MAVIVKDCDPRLLDEVLKQLQEGDIYIEVPKRYLIGPPFWSRHCIHGAWRVHHADKDEPVPPRAIVKEHYYRPYGRVFFIPLSEDEIMQFVAQTPREKVAAFHAAYPARVEKVPVGHKIYARKGGGAGSMFAYRYRFEVVVGEPVITRTSSSMSHDEVWGYRACSSYVIEMTPQSAVYVEKFADFGRIEHDTVLYVTEDLPYP
jgi:hypothetical protein